MTVQGAFVREKCAYFPALHVAVGARLFASTTDREGGETINIYIMKPFSIMNWSLLSNTLDKHQLAKPLCTAARKRNTDTMVQSHHQRGRRVSLLECLPLFASCAL